MLKATAATSAKLFEQGSKEPQKYATHYCNAMQACTPILWGERAKGPSAAGKCGLKYTCASDDNHYLDKLRAKWESYTVGLFAKRYISAACVDISTSLHLITKLQVPLKM